MKKDDAEKIEKFLERSSTKKPVKEVLHLESVLKKNGIKYEKEYRFAPSRGYRADLAIPDKKILIEYEGGMWTKSRHRTGMGYSKDCEKYNLMTILGFRLLRYTSLTVASFESELLEIYG